MHQDYELTLVVTHEPDREQEGRLKTYAALQSVCQEQ